MKSRFIYLINKMRRYRHAPLLGFAGQIVFFILGGICIGMISAWYMLEKGSPLTTTSAGSWKVWLHDGDMGADPYTLAHMSRSGRLPITSSNALYFIATEDNEEEGIAADCDYVVAGKPLAADWWSLALYTTDGRLIQGADKTSFVNSSSLLRLADGGYEINLAQKARQGNWIELTGEEDLVLMLRLYGIHATKDTKRNDSIEQNLPTIRRVDCR
jgi:hypothetical protein